MMSLVFFWYRVLKPTVGCYHTRHGHILRLWLRQRMLQKFDWFFNFQHKHRKRRRKICWCPNLHQHPTLKSCLLLRPVTKTTICSRVVNRRLHNKSFWQRAPFVFFFSFLTKKKKAQDKSLPSSFFMKIGLLSEAIVTEPDRAEWKSDSLQSSPVVFCLHCAALWPTVQSSPHWTVPLNWWTPLKPFWFCLFLYMSCLSFCIQLSRHLKAENMKLNHWTGTKEPSVSCLWTHVLWLFHLYWKNRA